MENAEISEASGIAVSRLMEDVLWIVNDGGHKPYVFAVGIDGADIVGFRLRDAQNVDWEDLSAYRFGNTSYILIADVGDNQAQREEYHLYIVPEPAISRGGSGIRSALDWEHRIRFVYEDGPQDCESVAVDPQNRKILMLSKRRVPPVLYALPLMPAGNQKLHIARRIAEIRNIPQPTPQNLLEELKCGRFCSQPTSMDITSDGSALAILTYKNGYLYRRLPHETWSAVFQRSPQLIVMPELRQLESLCFSPNGKSIYITSEKIPTPLYRLERKVQ
ncbi:MAG: hypothetical protein JSV31_15035 [Desulfobacterales bacterium]|nr:MAG: hypothetical protein JSV31_15035 [Desulfobacterales bacterium]